MKILNEEADYFVYTASFRFCTRSVKLENSRIKLHHEKVRKIRSSTSKPVQAQAN